ncbi:MAG: DUF3795 domain-containing protein [Chitinispirillales bacterium]|jgi:hypothetical protein|nr:DUF3795 domain-containing protein [Chitinispirillales bacterium]
MTIEQIKKSIAYCGLLCNLCRSDGSCDCRSANHCGKRSSEEGCFQHDCCIENGFTGCWECPDFSCGKDMFNDEHLRLKTFVKCIKEDGIEKFSEYILRNYKNGVVYHRNGYTGDYDLDTEEEILRLLRDGK